MSRLHVEVFVHTILSTINKSTFCGTASYLYSSSIHTSVSMLGVSKVTTALIH